LQELDFVSSQADTSLFILKKKDLTMYLIIYVDDIIIASSSAVATDILVKQLTSQFAVKDLGKL
jgi:hypothetical protein